MRPCARRVAAAEAGGAIAVASCELRVHASVSVRSAVCAIFSLPINLQAPVGHGPLASACSGSATASSWAAWVCLVSHESRHLDDTRHVSVSCGDVSRVVIYGPALAGRYVPAL